MPQLRGNEPTLGLNSSHEITKKVERNEPYTFIVGLFGYHKICIIKEDKMNTIFSMEW
jgi:hypothetical protein